jgi:hypothetical protein
VVEGAPLSSRNTACLGLDGPVQWRRLVVVACGYRVLWVTDAGSAGAGVVAPGPK